MTSDLSVSAWNPSPNSVVRTLAVSGSIVYAGGSFTSIGGQARNYIAALDATTGAATAWNPSPNAPNVFALAVGGSTIYVSGQFGSIGGQARDGLAALDAATGAATAWNPSANALVEALAVSGSTVYAAGSFSVIGGEGRNYVAALDATTGAATAWNPDPNGRVVALLVSNSTVYAAGNFTSIGGQSRNRIAAIDAAGAATGWDPNADNFVSALAVSGSTVYAGGTFTNIGGQGRRLIAALDATTGAATAWHPDIDAPNVATITASGSTVYVGGIFISVGGQTRNNIAAIDATTGAATPWNPSADNVVQTLAVSGSTVYAGGNFITIGGQTRYHIAALDAATGAATAWNPHADDLVLALALSGSTIYAAGTFTSIGGQARSRIAALDAATGAATAWNPNAIGGDLRALAVKGSTVYAGGQFTSIGGQARNRIAALDAATGNATAWNPNADNDVFAIAVSESTVYAGGQFTSVGGQARNRIVAIDATSGVATTWNPNADGDVTALVVTGCTIYAGGGFTSIGGPGGPARNHIVAIDATTGVATAWDPNVNGRINALVVSGATLYAGGDFLRIGGKVGAYIVAISVAPTIVEVRPASGGNDGSVTVTISGENLTGCTTVRLTRPGQPDILGGGLTEAGVRRSSADRLSLAATFDLRGAASGPWDVVVEDLGSGTLPNGFTVTSVAATQLRVDVVGPDSIRAGHPTAFDVVVGNPGNVDAQAVPVWITGIPTDATVTPDFPLSAPPRGAGEPDWGQVPDTLTRAGGRYVTLLLPRVPPGTVTRRVFLSVPGPSQQLRLHAGVTPPWADGAVLRACLAGNGVTQNASCVGAQLSEIQSLLASDFESEALNGIGVWARIGWRCEGATTLPDAIVTARRALDFLAQSIDPQGPTPAGCGDALRSLWRDSLLVHVVGAVDPNEKVGKRGAITSRQAIPYAIHFENDSSATANAQRVTVVDALPATVDVNTVSLAAVSFGNTQLLPLPGLNHGTWDVDLGPSRGIVVRVEAGFPGPPALTRQLVWSFASLDRATLQPINPNSPNGFLPPNHANHEGEGSVLFTVMPLAGLSTGAEIANQGSLTFDYSPPQLTEVWRNPVDNTPPASHVLPFNASVDSTTFTVRWEALPSPPDLKDFTIYAREDEGSYRVWRLCTPATADTFSGRSGHSYSFYCQARDTLGNIESAHASPDAQAGPVLGVGPGPHWRLALAGAEPNPAVGLIRARFTLPGNEAAALELLDVAGRRVFRRDVGALGPGEHTLVLGPPPRLPPGLYFLRLSQGPRALKARVVMVR